MSERFKGIQRENWGFMGQNVYINYTKCIIYI